MNTVIADSAPSDPAEVGMSGSSTNPTGPGRERDRDAPDTIDEMRSEIDTIDTELLRLIQRRTDLSKAIGATRKGQGGTRIVYSREMKVLDRFAELGPAGTDLGMMLLSLGRGRLGHR